MKKIKRFIDKTLESFLVAINYADDIKGIEIEKIAPLAKRIEKDYEKKPILGLFKRRPDQIIRLGHLSFQDSENKKHVNLGLDFLDFIFNEYDKWERELPKIINVFSAIVDATDVPDISKIVLTYINNFKISREKFSYNNFFTFPIIEQNGWDIKFHDLFIGFVPYEKEFDNGTLKVVIRIRSRGIEDDKYVFSLETVGSFNNFSAIPEKLEKYLEKCHMVMEDLFIKFLTKEYRDQIGLETEECD